MSESVSEWMSESVGELPSQQESTNFGLRLILLILFLIRISFFGFLRIFKLGLVFLIDHEKFHLEKGRLWRKKDS